MSAEQFLEQAKLFEEEGNYTRALECLVDYHIHSGSQRNLLEAEGIKAFLEGKSVELNESEVLDSIVEALATHGKYVITTHAPIPGIPEHSDSVHVDVPESVSDHLDLGKYDEDRDYGKTDRVTVTNRDTGDSAHFHVYPYDKHDGKTEYVVRSIGNKEKPDYHWDHKAALISHLRGEMNEGIEEIDAWKHEVHKTYPEHAGHIRFVSKENGKHISAEVPGMDRSFGVYDLEKNKGRVLEEAYLYESAPPGMEDWVKSNKDEFVKEYGEDKGMQILYATAWKMHNKKLNESEDIDSADYEETETGRKARAHHIRFKDEESEEKEDQEERVLESTDDEEDEDDPKVRMSRAMAAVDELGKKMKYPSAATYDSWNQSKIKSGELVRKREQEKLNENLKQVDGKWALVSKKDPSKVLQYYRGEGKPSDEWVAKVERRVHMFEGNDSLAKLMLSISEGIEEDIKQSITEMLDAKKQEKIQKLK